MKVPSLVWLQGPWSPAGYDVVEVEDEAAPASCPPGRRESPKSPWSPLGYQVVELAPPPGPELRDRPTRAARAVKGVPPRRSRRLGRWTALAAGVSCLAALALVLVLVRSVAQARSVPPAAVPAQQVKSLSAPAAAPEDVWPADRQGPDRETFGTTVEFVRNAPEAGRIADSQHKLLFLLHVSGNFEDAGFT
jgi:hypothetical protein